MKTKAGLKPKAKIPKWESDLRRYKVEDNINRTKSFTDYELPLACYPYPQPIRELDDPVYRKLFSMHIECTYDNRYIVKGRNPLQPIIVMYKVKIAERKMTETEYMRLLKTPKRRLVKEFLEESRKIYGD